MSATAFVNNNAISGVLYMAMELWAKQMVYCFWQWDGNAPGDSGVK